MPSDTKKPWHWPSQCPCQWKFVNGLELHLSLLSVTEDFLCIAKWVLDLDAGADINSLHLKEIDWVGGWHLVYAVAFYILHSRLLRSHMSFPPLEVDFNLRSATSRCRPKCSSMPGGRWESCIWDLFVQCRAYWYLFGHHFASCRLCTSNDRQKKVAV